MEDVEIGWLLRKLGDLYQTKPGDRVDNIRQKQVDNLLNKCQLLSTGGLAQQGWDFYYRYDYKNAFAYFKAAVADEGVVSISAALGLAKVYTRTGQWDLGRRWVLHYLYIARKELDDYNVAKGYGALAELFLRGGRPQEALACFQIAYQLVSPDNTKKAMQLNFMASALARNGEWFRARSLLYASIQASKIQADNHKSGEKKHEEAIASLLHSYARLAFIDIAQAQSGQLPKSRLPDTFSPPLGQLLAKAEQGQHCDKVCIAFLYAAAALVDIIKERNTTDNLIRALHLLNNTSMQEYYWLSNLLGEEQVSNLSTLSVISPPDHGSVLDKTWAVTLSDDGFGFLNTASFDELQKAWKLFFI